MSAFKERDLPLLTEVLSLHPSLLGGAHAVILIESKLDYPIRDLDELLAVFEREKEVRVGERTVSADQARQYLSSEYFFPIRNRRELICHMVRAFEQERMTVIAGIIRKQGGNLPKELEDVK